MVILQQLLTYQPDTQPREAQSGSQYFVSLDEMHRAQEKLLVYDKVEIRMDLCVQNENFI